LVQTLFYKFFLCLQPNLSAPLAITTTPPVRPISDGVQVRSEAYTNESREENGNEMRKDLRDPKKMNENGNVLSFFLSQSFQSSASSYPLSEPVPKQEAHAQASGELKFTCDIPSASNQVMEDRKTPKSTFLTMY
jgi:hypothetical protein